MSDDEKGLEELIDDFENDDEWNKFREQRIFQMRHEATQREQFLKGDHGQYTEIKEEKDFLKQSTSEKKLICHFFHDQFTRCRIMDDHLNILAKKHFEVKFVKMNVEKAPFFVEKLQIKVLPCVIVFILGISVDRIVGFEELGNTDNFTTAVLEKRLENGSDIFDSDKSTKKSGGSGGIFGFAKKNEENSCDDDD
eukprot:TRINITY_DN6334_c0_g1_i1.p1 TRINITY_DN6334_c0_g1~~TRINITY_DN6334_c0_g1_i1.p1  ORF type:complete len:220 (-),score=81.96 TRINITY_DN6334_c0_g1_i1:23-607(-)